METSRIATFVYEKTTINYTYENWINGNFVDEGARNVDRMLMHAIPWHGLESWNLMPMMMGNVCAFLGYSRHHTNKYMNDNPRNEQQAFARRTDTACEYGFGIILIRNHVFFFFFRFFSAQFILLRFSRSLISMCMCDGVTCENVMRNNLHVTLKITTQRVMVSEKIDWNFHHYTAMSGQMCNASKQCCLLIFCLPSISSMSGRTFSVALYTHLRTKNDFEDPTMTVFFCSRPEILILCTRKFSPGIYFFW